jgi:hypothetical protein
MGLVWNTAHADKSAGFWNLNLLWRVSDRLEFPETCLGNEMHLHVLKTKALLEIDQVDRGSGFRIHLGIGEEGLID